MRGYACKQYVFRSFNTPTFNAVHFDKNPYTCARVEKKTNGLSVSNFARYLSFSSGILVTKGLRCSHFCCCWGRGGGGDVLCVL